MQAYLCVLGLAALFLGWNMPNHYPPYPSYHSELLSAAGLALLAAGLALASRHRSPTVARSPNQALRMPRSAALWTIAALLPLAQFVTGQLAFREDLALGLLYGLGAASAIYTGHLWAARLGRGAVLRCLFGVVAAGAIAAMGIGLAQWLRIPVSDWWAVDLIGDRPFGNLAQSNHFGLLMTMGTIAAAALFELRVIRSASVFSVLAAFLASGILISQSRAAALGFLLALLCWLLTRRRVPTRLRVVPVLCALFVWLLLLAQFDAIQDAILPIEHHLRDRLDGGVRPAMWMHFWAAILAHPWFGYGFNQGVAAMAEVAAQLPASATRSTVFAHNFVLDLAVWAGLPFAIAATGAIAYWLLGWLRRGGDAVFQQQRHLVFALWLVLGVQSLLEYPYAYAYFLLPAALMAGAIAPMPAHGAPGPFWIPSWPSRIVCGLAFVLLAAVVWDYAQLEDDFRQARFARANYLNRPHHDFLDKPLVLDALSSTIRASLQPPKSGMSLDELAHRRALARRVQNPAVQIDYAKSLALNGRMPEVPHELAILRGLYAPEVYEAIMSEWQAWLAESTAHSPRP